MEFHLVKMSANQSFSDLTKEQQEELKKSEREHQEHLKRLAELYRQNNKNKSSAAIGGAGEELVKKVIEKAQCFALLPLSYHSLTKTKMPVPAFGKISHLTAMLIKI